jgi:DNA modification methylase
MASDSVYSKRSYVVKSVSHAKEVAAKYLEEIGVPTESYRFGLPEVDDRYHVWRVPVLTEAKSRLGEIVLGALDESIDLKKSTNKDIFNKRISELPVEKKKSKSKNSVITFPERENVVIVGDSEKSIKLLPVGSVGLVFTSPPYFNARPDYSEYGDYNDYLEKMRLIIRESAKVLAEGRFFVINISAVLIRRMSRSHSSHRIAVPFDLHRLFIEEGFDFIDDIIWEKPSGAGWATGRGRRFAADRTPLQYKAVPVTEYLLVYRKRTENLIDWNIRFHPDQEAVKRSKITGEYDATNIWRIPPSYSKKHPAIFPLELARRVIQYYSFEGDLVMDPFAGSGTVAKAAVKLNRRFAMIEMEEEYAQLMREEFKGSLFENPVEFLQGH